MRHITQSNILLRYAGRYTDNWRPWSVRINWSVLRWSIDGSSNACPVLLGHIRSCDWNWYQNSPLNYQIDRMYGSGYIASCVVYTFVLGVFLFLEFRVTSCWGWRKNMGQIWIGAATIIYTWSGLTFEVFQKFLAWDLQLRRLKTHTNSR